MCPQVEPRRSTQRCCNRIWRHLLSTCSRPNLKLSRRRTEMARRKPPRDKYPSSKCSLCLQAEVTSTSNIELRSRAGSIQPIMKEDRDRPLQPKHGSMSKASEPRTGSWAEDLNLSLVQLDTRGHMTLRRFLSSLSQVWELLLQSGAIQAREYPSLALTLLPLARGRSTEKEIIRWHRGPSSTTTSSQRSLSPRSTW